MNFPEMFYKLIIFFFSNVWTYLGLLLLIITIRGDITKGLKAIGGFFKKIKDNYKRIITKPGDFNIKGAKSKLFKE